MSQNPTLVFVPGAWHNASIWDKVASLLEAQQYKCIRINLPSTTGNPSSSFKDDVDAVRNTIIAEITQGHDVVVVVHSYGGAVGPSAIKGLTKPKEGGSSSGHVIGIASMASGFGATGISFIEGMGGKPPPSWTVDEKRGLAVIVAEPREFLYHDLPEEEGKYWVGKLEPQASKPLMDPEGGKYSYAGWMDVPAWYLATADDKAFPFEVQKMLVGIAKDAGGDITVREVQSSHSPMLSKPKEVVDFLLEAVAAFVK
ncbi:alpha/beta-hydrolase [Acephala macrosclerotiorum]|nr:alpha/beta-hydrolase [Acephala macrosclerotiorum]